MQYRRDPGVMQDRNRNAYGMRTGDMRQVNCCSVPTPFPDVTPVAMAFVPFQQSPEIYDEMKALCQGTLFPDLDKPFVGCMR